jgi:hypothetical protein
VHEDERVVVGAVGARVEHGVVGDVDGGGGDAEGASAGLHETVHAGELPGTYLDGGTEQLVLADGLEHADDGFDGELHGFDLLEGRAGLAIGDVGVRVLTSFFACRRDGLAFGQPPLKVELPNTGHWELLLPRPVTATG